MTAIYTQISANHKHPQGPWPLMLSAVTSIPSSSSPSFKLLDIASGMGEPALTIALSLPSATVVASDFSPDMVAAAARACDAVPNMTAMELDATDMSSIPSGSFDAVTCCYGYMFPENKRAALAETLRVLKPGGRLVATTWDSLNVIPLAAEVMADVLGTAPPLALDPMSLSGKGVFEEMVKAAGFSTIEITKSTYPFNYGADKSFQLKSCLMLVKGKIASHGKEQEAAAAFRKRVGDYATTEEDGNMVLPSNTFQMTVARKAE